MNNSQPQCAWDSVIYSPESRRMLKPRTSGITMVIDKGLGINQTRDLLELSAGYIDFIKIAFGSSVLYPTEVLRAKVNLIKAYGINVYPGGTLFEIAAYQEVVPQFIKRAKELGFTYLEVSEGTIDLPPAKRSMLIRQCADAGFGVLSEVGKKDGTIEINPKSAIEQIMADLEHGSQKVIIEGRDSGKGVGIYDDAGCVKDDLLNAILEGVQDIDKLIIEAPQTSQHNHLLTKLGPNVNLGNVQPQDVLTLESTRNGLRGDTLRNCVSDITKIG